MALVLKDENFKILIVNYYDIYYLLANYLEKNEHILVDDTNMLSFEVCVYWCLFC